MSGFVPLGGAEPEPSVSFSFDSTDSAGDVMDVLALQEFASGRQPHARSRRIERVRSDAWAPPDSATVLRTSRQDHRDAVLARGDGWTLLFARYRSGLGTVDVTAVSDELCASVLEQVAREVIDDTPLTKEWVEMGFWHLRKNGPQRNERPIATPSWPEIRDNYPAAAATALDRLAGVTADAIGGRLVLLHGPPGTGKTTALRSLAREWSKWAQFDCVLDPEELFRDPGYLMEVAVGELDDERRWRLLVLEDCDELISGDAKSASGQALSRLLNLTDGMLGQGRDVLVAITTNEPLVSLHPAVVRPGRCLAQIEIGRMSPAEAAAWLGRAEGVERGATLAELYALREGRVSAVAPNSDETGFYL